MSEKFPLNDTLSPINPQTWAELNENWDRIKSYFRHLQGQVNILAGGEEIDEVINRIDAAIINATNATDTANQIIDTLNIELPKVLTVLENAETAIRNAETVTASAQSAASAANVATGNANDATTAAINATNEANTAKSAAETAAVNANAATNDVLEATELATNAKDEAITATTDALNALTEMRQLINNFLHRGDWNSATNYSKNNLVSANGQTYIALQNNINKVVTDITNWRLFAAKGEKGDKGDTGAALSILDQLANESELPPTGEPGHAYTVNGDLYVWSENSNQWINVGNIKGEKGDNGLSAYQIALVDGFVGTESEWLESLKGERGEKGNDGSDATVTSQNITSALGYTPADSSHLSKKATTTELGHVMVDGETITVDENGVISGNSNYTLPIATESTIGGIMPDGETIIVDPITGVASAVGGASSGAYVVEAEQDAANTTYNLSIPDVTEYFVGLKILLKPLASNKQGVVRININSLGEKLAKYQTYVGSIQEKDFLESGKIYEFVYNGTDFNLIGMPFISHATNVDVRNTAASTYAVKQVNDKVDRNNIALTPTAPFKDEYTGAARVFKTVKVVTVQLELKTTAIINSNGANTITDLPTGYRPTVNALGWVYVVISGKYYPISVVASTNGLLTMRESPVNIPANSTVYGHITFVTEQI